MMLTQEKQTANSVAFKVELPTKTSISTEALEVKKRLEADYEKAAKCPLTRDQIEEKLKKAEEKRRVNLNHSLTRFDPKRVDKVNERKASLDQMKERKLQEKVTSQHLTAEEKRT